MKKVKKTKNGFLRYRNMITKDILVSHDRWPLTTIDGVVFVSVQRPSGQGTPFMMRKDSLELVKD